MFLDHMSSFQLFNKKCSKELAEYLLNTETLMFPQSVLFGTEVACCCYSSPSLETKESRRTDSHIETGARKGRRRGNVKENGIYDINYGHSIRTAATGR
jgi:hypothetical protein